MLIKVCDENFTCSSTFASLILWNCASFRSSYGLWWLLRSSKRFASSLKLCWWNFRASKHNGGSHSLHCRVVRLHTPWTSLQYTQCRLTITTLFIFFVKAYHSLRDHLEKAADPPDRSPTLNHCLKTCLSETDFHQVSDTRSWTSDVVWSVPPWLVPGSSQWTSGIKKFFSLDTYT